MKIIPSGYLLLVAAVLAGSASLAAAQMSGKAVDGMLANAAGMAPRF